MQVKVLSNSLHPHELHAINRINQALAPLSHTKDWILYCGVWLADREQHSREFDFILVTDCNLIVGELKHWDKQEITASRGKWFLGNKDMGRSPVENNHNLMHLLKSHLQQYATEFTNQPHTPRVFSQIVMTGTATYDQLPVSDQNHIRGLQQFIDLFSTVYAFNGAYKPHPLSRVLGKDRHIFEKIMGEYQDRPSVLEFQGYTQQQLLHEPQHGIYTDYQADQQTPPHNNAIMRLWAFDNMPVGTGQTTEQRYDLMTYEPNLIQQFRLYRPELYQRTCAPLGMTSKQDMTRDGVSMFELPTTFQPLNTFITQYCTQYREPDRLTVMLLLVNHIEALHDAGVSHGDIGPHSVWLTAGFELKLSHFTMAEQAIPPMRPLQGIDLKGYIWPKALMPETYSAIQRDLTALAIILWHIEQAMPIDQDSMITLQGKMAINATPSAQLAAKIQAGQITTVAQIAEYLTRPATTEPTTLLDNAAIAKYLHAIELPDPDHQFVRGHNYLHYVSGEHIIKCWDLQSCLDDPKSLEKLKHWLWSMQYLQDHPHPHLPKVLHFGIQTEGNNPFNSSCVLYVKAEQPFGDYNVIATNTAFAQYASLSLLQTMQHFHEKGIMLGAITDVFSEYSEDAETRTLTSSIVMANLPAFGDEYHAILTTLPMHIIANDYPAIEKESMVSFCFNQYLFNKELASKWDADEFSVRQLDRHRLSGDFNYSLCDLIDSLHSFEMCESCSYSPSIQITSATAPRLTKIMGADHLLDGYIEHVRSDIFKILLVGKYRGISLTYHQQQQRFDLTVGGISEEHIKALANKRKNFSLALDIEVNPSSSNDISALEEFLFDRKIELRIRNLFPELIHQLAASQPIVTELEPIIDIAPSLSPVSDIDTAQMENPAISLLATEDYWDALLITEKYAYPSVMVQDVPYPDSADGQPIYCIPCTSPEGVLATFGKNDIIEAFVLLNDKEVRLAEVWPRLCTSSELALVRPKAKAQLISTLELDTPVFLRSAQTKASYRRREQSLQRIMKGEAVIPDLMRRLDPMNPVQPLNYALQASDADLDLYDRLDNGKRISLNALQRHAFNQILGTGPVSFLQGPPGTGKTEFIAAIVHFLISNLPNMRILLASQSHEAVNTAAERIRKHCYRLKTPLDMVRFSNKESTVSPALLDVYSEHIIAQKKQALLASQKTRIIDVAKHLEIDPQYTAIRLDTELNLLRPLRQLIAAIEAGDTDDQETQQVLDNLIGQALAKQLLDDEQVDADKMEGLILSKINKWFSIGMEDEDFEIMHHKLSRLFKINDHVLEAIDSPTHKFTAFLAQSRQLVCGTLVGLGREDYGVTSQTYDWVIIDEAGRATASELAIAMQLGKRILLIGDHHQLRPLFSTLHQDKLVEHLNVKHRDIGQVLASDFERMFDSAYGKQYGASLLTQYRMAPPIGSLVSHCFYDGNLINGDRPVSDVYTGFNSPALQQPFTWLDIQHSSHKLERNMAPKGSKDKRLINDAEAKAIVAVLKQMAESPDVLAELKSTVKEGDIPIGIICMYAEQVRYVRTMVLNIQWPAGFMDLLRIDTVDSYQGKENRIIILSLVRNNTKGMIGFLKEPNRINVAMSRAMDRLIVVGDYSFWEQGGEGTPMACVIKYINDNIKNSVDGYQVIHQQ